MHLSITSKIFLGFFVVLLAFGGATIYGAWAVHTLGQQLRLVAMGYSTLRIQLQDQLTLQANLQKRLFEPQPDSRVQAEVTADRRRRALRLEGARKNVAELRRSLPQRDVRFLDEIDLGLSTVGRLYQNNDPLYDDLSGRGADREVLRQREEQVVQILEQLSREMTDKVLAVVTTGERYEKRVVWMTIFLAIGASGFGMLVMLLVQATLRPLRRLSEGAREVARGNYRQRVAEGSSDEVGALGREFNAMAAALEEREQRLRRSEQLAAVGKMAAQITHEVRNPLSSIGLNAELLADEVAGTGTEAQALAQAIVREVDRLATITEQYLRFARLPEPRFEREDISAVVGSLLQFHREELSGRGVTVQAELASGLLPVQLDENQLRAALLNLLRNAAEAMADLPGENRVLEVRTRATADGVAVEVIDRGPGISAENLSRIFEPFFTTKKGGTGLGLALAHEVVVRHGGALRVESVPGGGARFTMELPAVC